MVDVDHFGCWAASALSLPLVIPLSVSRWGQGLLRWLVPEGCHYLSSVQIEMSSID